MFFWYVWENFYFLQNQAVLIGNYRIVGATLWSYVPAKAKEQVSMCLNDYAKCYSTKEKQITVDETNQYVFFLFSWWTMMTELREADMLFFL